LHHVVIDASPLAAGVTPAAFYLESAKTVTKTWIKMCGTTNLADAQVCVEAGANAIGFIFAESPRRADPILAKEISRALSQYVERIGVFVNEPIETVMRTAGEAELTGVQLHGDESPVYVKELVRRSTERSLRIIKTIPAGLARGSGLGYFEGGENFVDAIMVDSGSVQMRGGTGQVFDWLRTGDFILWLEQRSKVIIAGGLNPENVGAAISLFHPTGVDVVTGVEQSYGKKDPEKVRAFVASVREAEKARDSGLAL
jgi:phosphoribosylanthranilate isomerase